MYRKLKVSRNDILRRLLGVPGCTSTKTVFVNTCQDDVDVLVWKQSYSFKRSIEGSHSSVIKFIFDSCSFKSSKLFAKYRDSIGETRM